MDSPFTVKYSIIIPHYNRPALLRKLLNTIPKTSAIQVIVIDDNSTRDKEELLQVINDDDRCEFYVNNSGIQSAGACRNIGLRHAKGVWILFADSDDFFMENFTAVLDKYFTVSEDIVFFIPTSINMATSKPSLRHVRYKSLVKRYLFRQSKKNELFLRYRFVSPASKMIKNSFIQKHQIKFDEVLSSNDVMFSVRAGFYMTSLKASRECIYCIVKSENSLTSAVNNENFDTRTKVFIDRYHFLEKNIPREEFIKLGHRGINYLILSFLRFRVGIRKILKTSLILEQENVNILFMRDYRLLKPIKALIFRTIARLVN